jgi:2-methylisocitrate lyase-like PEP mutase family enzyme
MTSSVQTLRQLLQAPGCHHFPTCYDALSAKLVKQAGFPLTFMSGAWVSAARLGAPDIGLLTLTEMADQMRYICGAVPGLPVLGDGDTGYGNSMNVQRTVAEYARAGAAGVMIEDQVEPKRCGHFDGKVVIPRAEARMKIRAAVDAAREHGVLIVARTDARAVEGFTAAMDRCADFVAEGADIVFLEAPASVEEASTFAREFSVPTLANIVPGGKSPVLSRQQLQDFGFKLAAYHPLMFASVPAMQAALEMMRNESTPSSPAFGFSEMRRILGLPEYDARSQRYKE